jgi:rubrerythrin
MKFFRCQICGDPFMGDEMPSHCPFCGAHQSYISTAAEWTDENAVLGEISDASHRNVTEALQLEVTNRAFYLDASARADTIELQSIFKNLSKIEGEHASAFRKILKVDPPGPEAGRDTASDSDHENLVTAKALEEHASAFYAQAAVEATEERINKVFKAVSEIEADHIDLEAALLDRGL